MSDRLTDERIADACRGEFAYADVTALAREVQARRLSDITTPICPTCDGSRLCDYLDSRLIGRPMFPCPDCTDGHIPLKVWVGMLTDALRFARRPAASSLWRSATRRAPMRAATARAVIM